MTRLAVLAGLRAEAALVERAARRAGVEVEIGLSGGRAERAAAEAKRLADGDAVLLASFGLAGGLDPALLPGAAVCPNTVILPNAEVRRPADAWCQAIRRHFGVELSDACVAGIDTAVTSASEKQRLARRTGAGIADMESHVLARAAADAGKPFVVLRAVCDPAEREVPPAMLRMLDESGRLRWRELPSVLRHFGSALTLAADSRRSMRTLWQLAKALAEAAAQPR